MAQQVNAGGDGARPCARVLSRGLIKGVAQAVPVLCIVRNAASFLLTHHRIIDDSLPLPLPLSLSLSPPLSLALSHTHTHTHILTLTQSLQYTVT